MAQVHYFQLEQRLLQGYLPTLDYFHVVSALYGVLWLGPLLQVTAWPRGKRADPCLVPVYRPFASLWPPLLWRRARVRG